MSALFGKLTPDGKGIPVTRRSDHRIAAWVQTKAVRASVRIDLGTGMIVYELYRVHSHNADSTPFYTESIPLDVVQTGEMDAAGVPPDG